MEEPIKSYCRFCAECKPSNKMLDLDKETKKVDETFRKLVLINAEYIDISGDNMLPKTICYICLETLDKACVFIETLKNAQVTLNELFSQSSTSKLEPIEDYFSDCDNDDITSSDHISFEPEIKIKQENESQTVTCNEEQYKFSESEKIETDNEDIKLEVKKEVDENNLLLDNEPTLPVTSLDCDNFSQGLIVQTILDVADLPFNPHVTLYAKEVEVPTKKAIRHWKTYKWICYHCNNEFPDISVLRLHSLEVHKNCNAFLCIDCNECEVKPYEYKKFIKHVKIHRKSLRNLCHYCDFKTNDIPQHLTTHFANNEVACEDCGEIFPNSESLLNHMKDNTVKVPRKPRRKRGTPLTIDDLTCKTCNKVYKNPNSLRDHKNTIHTSDRKRNYTCDRCGKTFFNKGTLTTHIMSHDKIRPHICKICNRSFLYPNMLRRHVEMHSGVKPFSCEQCGRRFRLQYQLNAHKIIHTDNLPYICQYCSKAFRFKQILKNHERQHTGAKPYSCQICVMEFTNWSNYNKHMKRRHNKDTSKKKITLQGVFPVNPETGQLIQIEESVFSEWKKEIMIPVKRGKKKVLKSTTS